MRVFQATLGLLLFLLVVASYQPFRDVGAGRAGQEALDRGAVALGALPPLAPQQAVYVAGVLQAASDVRRQWPLETVPSRGLLGGVEHVVLPGTWLRDDSGEVSLEGTRIALAGHLTDYPFGVAVAAYGTPRGGAFEVWGLATDATGLRRVAEEQTVLLRFPALLVGALLGLFGYALALGGTYCFGQALWPTRRLWRPRLAGVTLALYWMVGFGLLASAWAMLGPMVGSGVGAAVGALTLSRRGALSRRPATR